jgi:hypothetical protein
MEGSYSRRRTHQVKVSLEAQDAAEVASCAQEEGVACGTFVRRLTLRHLAAVKTTRVTASVPRVSRDNDARKFGCHVSVLFTADEYARLQQLAGTGQTVSGYVGRCVVERGLLARRSRLGSPSGSTQPRRTP